MQALKSAPSLSIPNAFQAAGRKIFLYRNVVHGNRNTEHGAKGDQVCTDVAVADSAMVCTPVVHYIVSSLANGAFLAMRSAVRTRCRAMYSRYVFQSLSETSSGSATVQPSCDLQNRAKAFHQIQTDHGSRHLSCGQQTA